MLALKSYMRWAAWPVLVILCLVFTYRPVSAGDDCLGEIRAIFQHMYNTLPQEKGKNLYVNYEVISHVRHGAKSQGELVTHTSIRTYAAPGVSWFISSDICVYQDKSDVITVLPGRKVIYWARSTAGADKTDRLKALKTSQDSILYRGSTATCSVTTEFGADKVICVTPEKKYSDLLHIKSVYYYILSAQKQIKKLVINYNENSKTSRIEHVYKEMNPDYTAVNLNVPVKSLVFASGSKLKPEYKDYRLIDVRKDETPDRKKTK
ncbi:MAG: hypothetical protein JST26_10300 [Bacteroidetes bacterium]|nr:hypothetical protein [Bacteroidota bacterium]